MDIQSISDFIVVCDYRNISKSAEILHISQSALSRRMLAMENELGVQLLDRSGNKIELTPAGLSFLEDAKRIVGKHEQMMRRIEKYRDGDAIHIGFSQGLFMRWLIDRLAYVKEKLPDRRLYFTDNHLKINAEDLVKGNLDIIYTLKGEVDGLPEVEYKVVIENEVSMLVPFGHRLWNHQTISFEDLIGEKICTTRDSVVHNLTWSKTLTALRSWLPVDGMKELQYCSNVSEVCLYVCVNGYLGLSGRIGYTDMTQYPDKMRNIKLNCNRISHGDIVVAYRKGDSKVEEVVRLMVGK